MNHKDFTLHVLFGICCSYFHTCKVGAFMLSHPRLRFLILGKIHMVTVCHYRLYLILGQSDYSTQMVLSLRPYRWIAQYVNVHLFDKKKSQFLAALLFVFLNKFLLSCILPKHNLSNLYPKLTQLVSDKHLKYSLTKEETRFLVLLD